MSDMKGKTGTVAGAAGKPGGPVAVSGKTKKSKNLPLERARFVDAKGNGLVLFLHHDGPGYIITGRHDKKDAKSDRMKPIEFAVEAEARKRFSEILVLAERAKWRKVEAKSGAKAATWQFETLPQAAA